LRNSPREIVSYFCFLSFSKWTYQLLILAEKEEEFLSRQPDVMNTLGEWGDDERERAPTKFEKENPNILMLNTTDCFKNM